MSMITDRALIVETFEGVFHRDWRAVREALGRIDKNKGAFIETRDDIKARGIVAYLASQKKPQIVTLDQAVIILKMRNSEAQKPNEHGQRSPLQDDAVKSGANAWDYIVKTAGYTTLEARGGANKGTRKPRTPDTKTPQGSDAPVTLPSVIIPKAAAPVDVNAFYLDSVRPFLIKAQKINADQFKGAKGNAILVAHKAFVEALNAAASLGDE